mmetsp:Transcript_82280/g.255528  ORF Transcript_82280/g.255528 Transcript_82280/m.255528 type:complete len:211 (+) Transcript_82280:1195-1827(+)
MEVMVGAMEADATLANSRTTLASAPGGTIHGTQSRVPPWEGISSGCCNGAAWGAKYCCASGSGGDGGQQLVVTLSTSSSEGGSAACRDSCIPGVCSGPMWPDCSNAPQILSLLVVHACALSCCGATGLAAPTGHLPPCFSAARARASRAEERGGLISSALCAKTQSFSGQQPLLISAGHILVRCKSGVGRISSAVWAKLHSSPRPQTPAK